MAINPQKVLLIYNTNSNPKIQALNTQNGVNLRDWYAGVRGLTGSGGPTDYYWMGFDFGTANYVTALGANGSYLSAVAIDGPSSIACTACSPKLPSQVGVRLSTALKNAGAAGAIEAVLVLPGVPSRVKNTDSAFSFSNYQFIELALAYAACKDFPNTTYFPAEIPTAQNAIMGPMITDATLSEEPFRVPNGIWRSIAPRQLTNVRDLKTSINEPCGVPCGKIGWVPSDGSEPNPDYSYAWGCSTFAQAQTIVSNAIEAEKVDNFSKLHVLGGVDYALYGGNFLSSLAINRLGFSAGLNVSYIADLTTFGCIGDGYSENSWWDGTLKAVSKPDGWTAAWPPTNRPNWAGWEGQWPIWKSSPGAQLAQASGYETLGGGGALQGAGGVPITLFGFMSPRMSLAVKNPSNLATFEPGGFTYAWMSAAAYTQEYCLRNGGSLGFGCGGEPGSYSLPDSDALLYFLLNGYCGAEATLRSGGLGWAYNGATAGWRYDAPDVSVSFQETFAGTVVSYNVPGIYNKVTAHGDPLYAPYKARNLQPRLMQVG